VNDLPPCTCGAEQRARRAEVALGIAFAGERRAKAEARFLAQRVDLLRGLLDQTRTQLLTALNEPTEAPGRPERVWTPATVGLALLALVAVCVAIWSVAAVMG
jgi:hypothetical protein